jgi:N-acetyl-anhydromuramoyl-L-alanine amidase
VNAAPSFVDGWLNVARRVDSPNFDARPDFATIDVVVLHHISLPAGRFDGDAVERLFTNRISSDDPQLAEVAALRVSAHFFVRRDGEIVQFVSALDRAWHAGISCWRGRERVNDFSIGIEIEGDADTPFTDAQYETLRRLLTAIRIAFNVNPLTNHGEIAFGRKIDPGAKFDLALVE